MSDAPELLYPRSIILLVKLLLPALVYIPVIPAEADQLDSTNVWMLLPSSVLVPLVAAL